MKAARKFCDCGCDFSGLGRWVTPKSPRPMQFFSESLDESNQAGAFGVELSLRWRALPLSEEIRNIAQKFQGNCKGTKAGETCFNLPFVSGAPSPFGLYVRMHGHVDSKNLTFLRIDVSRVPASKPPAAIAERSDSVGGYPEGFRKILSELPKEKSECGVDFSFFAGDEKKWRVKIPRPPKFQGDLTPFKIEAQSFELEGPDETTVNIQFLESGAVIRSELKIDVAPQEGCIENACAEVWAKISNLFEPHDQIQV